MGNASSAPKISAQDRAILDMKNQRDKLHQYQKRIRVLTDRETEIARECLRKQDVERAKLALRRKKYQETLLTNTDKSLAQLEMLTNDIEFALVQKDVLFGLQQGTSVLKEIQREMGGVERVEQLMGESEEARAYQEEISDMLGGKLSHHDEDEVDSELEAMEMELFGQKLPDAPKQELPEQQRVIKERDKRRTAYEGTVRDEEPMLAL